MTYHEAFEGWMSAYAHSMSMRRRLKELRNGYKRLHISSRTAYVYGDV